MFQRRQPTRLLSLTLLIIILIIAAGLRFYNLGWDDGTFAHPDERSTVAFYAPTIRWPADSSTLLDPRASPLNPFWEVTRHERRSYTYGHFPLYTLVLAAEAMRRLAGLPGLPPDLAQFMTSAPTPSGYALVGRGLVALSDLFSVLLLFLIGRRLYGLWAGLLAAALSALTVLQIQLAHFFAVDPISTTFTLLAIYGAMTMVDRPSWRTASLTGLGIGLAVASKFSALPIALAPVVAVYFAAFHPPLQARDSQLQIVNPKSEIVNQLIGLVALALGVAFIVFAVTSPFVLLDFGNFWQAVIEEQGNMVSGVADFPFTRQYRGTPAYGYFIEQQIRWGMGWPLGLLSIAGLVWVIIKAVRGKAQPGEWIILGWLIFYFGPTGLFLAKFMRYMSPVTPLLVLFGAGMVVALWVWGKIGQGSEGVGGQGGLDSDSPLLPRSPTPLRYKLAKVGAVALAAITLAGTAFWALAFANGVYGTEHTWVTFARWMYANVPDGSCIAWEHWDDRMPVDLPESRANPGARGYYQPQLPMYEEDTPQKYQNLRDTLINCDYIVLATNRLWRTIPKLPQRYPMSTRYYEALFAGELGYEQVYTAETPPTLGPITIDDQPADESFTVYDHPKPTLFKKTRQLRPEEWDALLGNAWIGATPGYVGEPTLLMRLRGAGNTPAALPLSNERRESKTLLLDWPVDQLPVVNDFSWNALANNSTPAAVGWWWLVITLLGLVTWPITFALFSGLPDRGYGLSRSLGLLLVSYFVWINSSLGWLGNTALTALIGLMVLAGFSLWTAIAQKAELGQFWRKQRRLILISEVVFGLAYLFFIYLRLLNPDLWQPWLGGEKMLEMGFLNAVVKSAHMPPYDPFFAGGLMNYYYYGLFLVGVLIKLTGIQPSIAFNLAVPTLAALTAINIFSLAGNLSHVSNKNQPPGSNHYPVLSSIPYPLSSIISGLLAILFVVFIGNLEGAAQFLRELGKLSQSSFQSAIPGLQTVVLAFNGLTQVLGGQMLAPYNYWDPTRVIPATINEFPYFSFLFADLHPHMIGLPFTVLFLALAFNWLASERTTNSEWRLANGRERKVENEGPNGTSPLPISNLSFTYSLTRSLTDSFTRSFAFSLIRSFARFLALPFVLGAIAIINTWDLPTYLGLMAAVFLLGRYRREPGSLTLGRAGLLLVSTLIFTVALLAVTYLLYAPFFANYQAIDVGLGLVYTQTALDQHLKIWGFFLFIIASWLGFMLLYPNTRHGLLRALSLALRRWNVLPHLSEIYKKLVKPSDSIQLALWGLGLVLVIALGLWLLGYRVPAYLLPLVSLALLLLIRRETGADTAYLNLLAFTGLLVLLGVEFFFLRDFLGGGEYYRMNTLFKFYIQVWVMFGLTAAVITPRLWLASEGWVWLRWPWRIAFTILLLATLIYPVLGTRTRLDDRFPGDQNRPPIGTLDGLAYMTVGVFEWPAGSPISLKHDYEAIRWLQDNVFGTPIIAEAKVGFYREGGMRVAAYTGLPSILGGLHQSEQRYAWQVGDRDFLVSEFWSSPDPARTLQLLDQLGVTYVYIGQIERITHGNFVADKFEQLRAQGALELVFENEQTKIYKRLRSSQ